MAISRVTLSSVKQGFPKSRSFLDGNSAYIPTSFESIQTYTLVSSQASVTFSSIPSTYKHLQLRLISQDTNNNNFPASYDLEFNGSAGTDYDRHEIIGDGSAATSNGFASTPYIRMTNSQTRAYTGMTNNFGASIIEIIDYASISKNKVVRAFTGAEGNSTGQGYAVNLISGEWRSTAAITQIKLTSGNSFSAKSTFALYGIK